jgi:uncharacterized protein DUF1203
MSYKVVPISNSAADHVRKTMISPHGNLPAFSSVATGYGPCRSCLSTFKQGEEERIYISYDPFASVSDLPLPGPVFIHTEDCQEYSGEGFPAELLSIPILLEGFGENSRLVVTEKVDTERLDDQILGMLNVDGVRFIHIRNAEAGCFIAKIERV